MTKDRSHEENWDELKSRLPEHKHQAPPDGYFDSLPDRMIDRWENEKLRKHARIINIRKWLTVAAVSTGVLICGWWWLNLDSSADIQASYTSTEAYQYVMENIDEFSSLVEDHIPDPTQSEIQLPKDSAVEEYLLDELEGQDLEQIF